MINGASRRDSYRCGRHVTSRQLQVAISETSQSKIR